MSSTHGPARTGADPLRPLAVRALRVWISAALVPADVILLSALFPDTESPDGERAKRIGASSGRAMCGGHRFELKTNLQLGTKLRILAEFWNSARTSRKSSGSGQKFWWSDLVARRIAAQY